VARKIVDNKWLQINTEIAYNKTIGCNKIMEFKNRQFFYKVKCDWEYAVTKAVQVEIREKEL
jgi:hypothetical protein